MPDACAAPLPPPPLADANMGICGDWLVSPNVEGAALSGIALAEKISAQVRTPGAGLNQVLRPPL